MKCPECKTENEKDANFCCNCRYPFEVELIKKTDTKEKGVKQYTTPEGKILIRIQKDDRVFMNTDNSVKLIIK